MLLKLLIVFILFFLKKSINNKSYKIKIIIYIILI